MNRFRSLLAIFACVALVAIPLAALGQSLSYTSTTPTGAKIKSNASRGLAAIDEVATLWAIVQELTKAPVGTAPAAGDIKGMLEIGYAATAVTMTVDQSAGGSPGNCANGSTYTGGTSAATGVVEYQDDTGSVAHMLLDTVSGTFQLNEILTCSAGGGTAQIDVLDLTPGGGNDKFEGEVQIGVEAGSGATFYDEMSTLATDAAALRDNYVRFFQGD